MRLVNPHWFDLGNMVSLASHLQTSSAKKLTKETCEKICKELDMDHMEAQNRFLAAWIEVAKSFIQDVYRDLESAIHEHAYRYPMKRWPLGWYDNVEGRQRHEKVQAFLRKIPGIRERMEPGAIINPVPPTILPGVDYSAESLVFGGHLQGTDPEEVKKRDLEWMKRDASADYSLGVVCFGSEDFEVLTNAWFYGKSYSMYSYVEALDTLIEETLHHIADQIAKKPRYGDKETEAEHYWMHSYGNFPEKVYQVITDKANNYISGLKVEKK